LSKSPDVGRVILDEKAKLAVEEMLDILKKQEDCIRLNSSKLVSWIVARFRHSRFERDQQAIVKAHFNSKEYLKKVVSQSATETDLTEALQAMLARMNSSAGVRRGRRKKQAMNRGCASYATDDSSIHPEDESKD
jgi:hypothetical protein